MMAKTFDPGIRHCDAYRQRLHAVERAPAQSLESTQAEGLWRSEGGSLYRCDGRSLVCISVHSAAFSGWVGKVAVRMLRETGGVWEAEQAFRDPITGELAAWRPVTLVVSENRMTKYFDKCLPSGVLVYGHVENYYRVQARQAPA